MINIKENEELQEHKMNDTAYKIIKLTNGEDIIATVVLEDDNNVEIHNPLLMSIIPHMTIGGQHESINLSPWMQPHSEQSSFTITKSTIVTSANVSEGLSKYYEYFLKKLAHWEENDNNVNKKVFRKEHTDDEIYDELLDELETENKSIH